MKHSFKFTPVKNEDRVFKLHINGKYTGMDYFYNNVEYVSNNEADEDFYEQLKPILCKDIPENVVLSSGHTSKLKYGKLYDPDISRIKNKLKIEVYYTTGRKKLFESNINLLQMNLCLINILKKQNINYQYIDEDDYYVNIDEVGQLTFIPFIVYTDTNGTIEEKFNSVLSIIKKAEAKAEKKVLKDLVAFAKKLK